MSQRIDLQVDAGATFRTMLTFNGQNGTPINFTGCTAEMQIREMRGAGAAYVTITDQNGLTLGGTTGTIAILLTPTQTASLPTTWAHNVNDALQSTFVYDILVTFPSGDRYRYAHGIVTVSGAVTALGQS